MPFGISSAPEVFHRLIHDMFADIKGVETYIDDILIHAPTQGEHDHILKVVLDRCKENNLKLNLAKCFFNQAELKYLGHIIAGGQLKADPMKVRAIAEMPKPQDAEEAVTHLLGMATYLAKFIPGLSVVSTPLRERTDAQGCCLAVV